MLGKIEHLTPEERQLIMDAPLLISTLVAGADGEFLPEEISKAVKIIHIKTYSETRDISGVYKAIAAHSEAYIDELIESLPANTDERNRLLVDRLKGLNGIFPKLDDDFAHDLLSSLRELAYYVSQAGDLGIGMRTEQEKEMAKLPFLSVSGKA